MNTVKSLIMKHADEIVFPYSGEIVHAGICQEYENEHPILVFSDGSVKYYETIVFNRRKHKKLIVILEKGGQNCHLMINSNEMKNLLVLFLPDAKRLLSNGQKVLITGDGRIQLREK